jgi:gas vesicle protein
MKTTKLILGLAAAAVTGAAIGMLLAPEKGSDLQKKIKEGAQDWLDEISKMINNGKEFASDMKSSAEDAINETARR